MSKKNTVMQYFIDNSYLDPEYAIDEFYNALTEYVRDELVDEDLMIEAVYKQIKREENYT